MAGIILSMLLYICFVDKLCTLKKHTNFVKHTMRKKERKQVHIFLSGLFVKLTQMAIQQC